MVKHLFEAISVITGLWAAGFWWWSSRVPVPERKPGQTTADPTVEMIGEAFATTRNLFDMGQAVRKSSRISGAAAVLTAISVGAQAIATGLGW